jgi:hypothetical protein
VGETHRDIANRTVDVHKPQEIIVRKLFRVNVQHFGRKIPAAPNEIMREALERPIAKRLHNNLKNSGAAQASGYTVHGNDNGG